MSILSLNSYEDLLSKCQVELQQLQSVKSNPEYDFMLFNLVLGMNHLFEWYLKEKNINEKMKMECIKKFNPFASPYDVSGDFKGLYRESDFPETNPYQEVVRKLCNKAKHFKKQAIEKQDKHYTASCGSVAMQCGNPDASCGAFSHYIYTVEIAGEDKNLTIIMSQLINDWVNFTGKCV